jgi:hypothetical protein
VKKKKIPRWKPEDELVEFEASKRLIDYIYSEACKHKGPRFSSLRSMAVKYSKRLYQKDGLPKPSYFKLVRAHNDLRDLIDSIKSKKLR